MKRAVRLLTLAYKAHQRGETEIASRISTLAFAEPDAAEMFEDIHTVLTSSEQVDDEVYSAEAILRKAEATAEGKIFTSEGVEQLLDIARATHQAGFPKVAKSISRAAQ